MDLESTDHLLCTTRSVRKRLDFSRPISDELIQKCIDIALQAPTGSNMQGWSVVVVTDEDKKKGIADLYREGVAQYAKMREADGPAFPEEDLRAGQQERVMSSALYLAENLEKAPVFVLFCIDGRVEQAPQFAQASVYGSILPAAWSFMLAGRSRGLGMAWTTLHLAYEKKAAEILELPDHVTQAVLFPVAYYTGTDFKPAKRISPRSLTHWNRCHKESLRRQRLPPLRVGGPITALSGVLHRFFDAIVASLQFVAEKREGRGNSLFGPVQTSLGTKLVPAALENGKLVLNVPGSQVHLHRQLRPLLLEIF